MDVLVVESNADSDPELSPSAGARARCFPAPGFRRRMQSRTIAGGESERAGLVTGPIDLGGRTDPAVLPAAGDNETLAIHDPKRH
jgi:hypothetical protein